MFDIKVADVKGFLKEKGHDWDGKIGRVEVDDGEFGKNIFYPVWLSGLKCDISPIKFLVYGASFFTEEEGVESDWSKDWINYLIQNRGNEYVPYIKRWCELQKSRVTVYYDQQKTMIERRLRDLKQCTQNELRVYQDIEDIVDSKLGLNR